MIEWDAGYALFWCKSQHTCVQYVVVGWFIFIVVLVLSVIVVLLLSYQTGLRLNTVSVRSLDRDYVRVDIWKI